MDRLFAIFSELRETRLFLVLASIVPLACLVFEINTVLTNGHLIGGLSYIALMAIHITLYWLSPWFAPNMRRTITYLLIQVALIFCLNLFTRDVIAALCLYPGLLGLAVAMLQKPIRIFWGILAWVAVATFNLILGIGIGGMGFWWVSAPPLTIFVVLYVALYTRQAAARSQAQGFLADLERTNRELSEYAAQVESLTRANERQRIARELHDTLAQGVAGLVMQLEAIDSHLTNQRPQRAQEVVRQSLKRARETLSEARASIDGLRQVEPDGLPQRLEKLVAEILGKDGIACQTELSLCQDLTPLQAETIERIAAESLLNIARHAKARRAWLSLRCDGQEFTMEIGDDGIGFKNHGIFGKHGHYGILGMQERVMELGGMLEVHSEPGRGTRVVVAVGRPSAVING